MIIDFHAHCLPHMDDGAADIATAVNMLTEAGRQGVSTVVATPHFYLGQETASSFLERRQAAREALRPHLPADAPHLVPGAEVLLREGISRLDLHPLCIEGTDCLLAELPFMQPPYWLYEELENIVYGQQLTLILAHVDRYMPWYSSNSTARPCATDRSIASYSGGYRTPSGCCLDRICTTQRIARPIWSKPFERWGVTVADDSGWNS